MNPDIEIEALRTSVKAGEKLPFLRVFFEHELITTITLRDYADIEQYKQALIEAASFVPFTRGNVVSVAFQLEDDRYALLFIGVESTGGAILNDVDAEAQLGVEPQVFDKDTIEILRNFVYTSKQPRYAREMITTLSRLGHGIVLFDESLISSSLSESLSSKK